MARKASNRYAHVYKRTSTNGTVTWQFRFDFDGVEQNKGGFTTASAAHEARKARERALLSGKLAANAPKTAQILRRFVEDVWYPELDRSVADGSRQSNYVDGMKADFETYIFPKLGRIRLDLLDEDRIKDWIDDLRANGRKHPAKNGDTGLAVASVRAIYNSLHLPLKYATKKKYIGFNPMADVPRGAKPRARTGNTYNETELRIFYEGVRDNLRWFALFVLLFNTGMRRGEIAGLRWDVVDLTHRKLEIIRQRPTDASGRAIEKDRLKTKSSRRPVELNDALVHVLRQWKVAQQAEFACKNRPWSEQTHVFTNPKRLTAMHPSAFNRELGVTARRLGLKVLHLHDGRHTAATMLMGKVATKVVTEMLGHSSTAITEDLYMHTSTTMHRDAVDMLGALVPIDAPAALDELAARRHQKGA